MEFLPQLWTFIAGKAKKSASMEFKNGWSESSRNKKLLFLSF